MEESKSRIISTIHDDWLFHLGGIQNGEFAKIDDEQWRILQLPHDWSIEGQFKQFRDENWAMLQNWDHRIGYLPQGIGWYRKHLFIPESYKNKKIFIQFDGVYRDSDVWINEKHLGNRPYGYSTFCYDLTNYISFGKENLIAVRVNNTGVASRWYSGSGIYRKVTLIVTDKVHVSQWGTYWTTPEVTKEKAVIKIKTTIDNESGNSTEHKSVSLLTEIFEDNDEKNDDPQESKKIVAQMKTPLPSFKGDIKDKIEIEQELKVNNPKLWFPDNPQLYKIKSTVLVNNQIVDEYWTPIGFRYFKFDPNEGFFLNGKNMKFKGVCLHHDNGCLGSIVHKRAVERKLEIMKSVGCNAIRTSHNPPEQELLELADKMGFMIMDEVLDEWKTPKTPWGYTRYFDEWYERDVRDFVKRDRNHPSIVIWSCGNEVPEQGKPNGVEILKKLLDIFHEEDPTRPVTQGGNLMNQANRTGFSDMLDVTGYNYYGDQITKLSMDGFEVMYDLEHKNYPNRVMIGSENASDFVTRGIYHFPIPIQRFDKKWDDFYCSAHDVRSELPLIVLKTRPYVCGLFRWTGFDYIGEPTPYPWPARSSQFGLVDLCGFPKDSYYLYKSQWSDEPIIHILPHWNWNKEEIIPVWVYSNCESIELFLNGKSLGEKSFLDEDYSDLLHLMWDVPYEPGELKAIGKKKGEDIISESVVTSKTPHKLKMEVDRAEIKKDGDLAYIKVSCLDIDGNFVPNAQNLVIFITNGLGSIIGTSNGNPISHEPFQDQQRHLFNGLCLAVVKSDEHSGIIKIKATSWGLLSDELEIESK